MRNLHYTLLFLLGSFVLCNGDAAADQDPVDVWRPLLDQLGLQADQVTIDPDEWALAGGLSNPLTFQRLLFRKPFQAGEYASRLAKTLLAAHDPGNIVRNLSILIDQRVGRLLPPSTKDAPPPEAGAIKSCLFWYTEMERQAGKKRVSTRGLARKLRKLPIPVVEGLRDFFQCCAAVYPWMRAGSERAIQTGDWKAVRDQIYGWSPLQEDWLSVLPLMEKVDIRSILFGSAILLNAVASIRSVTEPVSKTSLKTSLGRIFIGGRSDDVYAEKRAPLLIIDYGGNDRYEGCFAAADPERPLSVVIDLGGRDSYRSAGGPLEGGSAFLGCSILWDRGDDTDTYQGHSRGLGYSLWGVSAVIDDGGDDQYEVRSGLGAGIGGVGILLDRAGDDTYIGVSTVQGFGTLGGAGLLLDVEGNDSYECRPTPVSIPSAQDPATNASFGQGCGLGHRRNLSDGHSFGGGIGLLVDGAGEDTYRTGVFGQGVGYYYGVGILVDESGNDSYEAVWYAQGAAAHEAGGVFIDESGNDTYHVSKYAAQGAAVDFSVAFFRDGGGDDVYESHNVSLGAALTSSIALFEDSGGNDRYLLHDQRGLGAARSEMRGSFRDLMITVGLFLDRGGTDTYPRDPWRNDSFWRWSAHEDNLPLLRTEHGGGMDMECGMRSAECGMRSAVLSLSKGAERCPEFIAPSSLYYRYISTVTKPKKKQMPTPFHDAGPQVDTMLRAGCEREVW